MDKKKILIVDDEQDLLDFVKLRLEANNYDVITAIGGEEALEVFKTEKPDLVLLDILMPKLDGFKVCQALKNDPVTANIPVIMLTAKDRAADIKEAKRIGADGYIIKPFDAATLLFNIKDQLSKIKAE
jgi:DNA-binding response OmpR family regulator